VTGLRGRLPPPRFPPGPGRAGNSSPSVWSPTDPVHRSGAAPPRSTNRARGREVPLHVPFSTPPTVKPFFPRRAPAPLRKVTHFFRKPTFFSPKLLDPRSPYSDSDRGLDCFQQHNPPLLRSTSAYPLRLSWLPTPPSNRSGPGVSPGKRPRPLSCLPARSQAAWCWLLFRFKGGPGPAFARRLLARGRPVSRFAPVFQRPTCLMPAWQPPLGPADQKPGYGPRK